MRDVHPIKHAVECGNLTGYETSAHNQKAVGCENLIKIKHLWQELINHRIAHNQSHYTEQMSWVLKVRHGVDKACPGGLIHFSCFCHRV